jgi:uncharacterized protein (DUF362 family)
MSDIPPTDMRPNGWNRRGFLRSSLLFCAGAQVAVRFPGARALAADSPLRPVGAATSRPGLATVAMVACRGYGGEARSAMEKCFDLLGGIGSLVKDKTVTVKVNLTGTDFSDFLERPVGETYMTHYDTALALGSLLFRAGARRVRLVESTTSRSELAESLAMANWDVKKLESLGPVQFENTRNLCKSKGYSHLSVPKGGYMFSSFEFNPAYVETDVVVSLAKLKTHLTAGVTLSMKNMFGITPNALYGDDAGSEDSTGGRSELHTPEKGVKLPGLKPGLTSIEPGWRVPRAVADICVARPVHLAIIDGITSMSGGEGPWCRDAGPVKVTTPGVLIAGLNPVSTDAVGTAVMGFANPRAVRGTKPFELCDNHLLLAEEAGIGTADLAKIEVRGLTIEKAKYPYP